MYVLYRYILNFFSLLVNLDCFTYMYLFPASKALLWSLERHYGSAKPLQFSLIVRHN